MYTASSLLYRFALSPQLPAHSMQILWYFCGRSRYIKFQTQFYTNVITFEEYDLVGHDAMHVDKNQRFLRTAFLRLQDRRVSYLEDEARNFLDNYFKVVHVVHFYIQVHLLLRQLNNLHYTTLKWHLQHIPEANGL